MSSFTILYSNLLPTEGLNSLLCALVLLTIPVVYRWKTRQTNQNHLSFSAIPALTNNIPFLGNIHFFKSTADEIVKTFCIEYMNKYGSIYRFHIGGKSFAVLSSPELVKPILESQKFIKRSVAYYALQPMLGETFFFVSDARWKSRRRTVLTVAKTKFIKSVVDVFNQRSVECVEKIERAIAGNISSPDEQQGNNEIDVVPIISECIYDITCDTMIGKGHSKEEIRNYNNNFHKIIDLITKRFSRIIYSSSLVFNMSIYGRESNKCLEENRNFIEKVFIEKKRFSSSQMVDDPKQFCCRNLSLKDGAVIDSNSNIESPDNFLDFMVQHIKTDCNMSDENVVNDTGGLMFAAQDTTSACLTWFLYLIAKHPIHQKRVLDELKSVFGDNSDRPCSIQDACELKYLECCIKETLRLYPSAVLIERLITEDVEIGGYILPAGVSVLVNIFGLHRSPLFFPEPEVYKPERFQSESSIDRHRYAYIPFSSGARGCPGQSYAILELKIFLSVLLRKFHFSLPNPSEELLDFTYKIVSKTIDGKMNLIVSKRLPT